MFTGIIREVGRVVRTQRTRAGRRLVIEAKLTGVRESDSVAVDGVCLTSLQDDGLMFDVVPETLKKTTLGSRKAGARVNLEPSLRAGDPIGGHFVQGHIDGTGRLLERSRKNGVTLRVGVDPSLSGMMIPKGAVALDGVSLTIVEVGADFFTAALVPYTLSHTTLGKLKRGDLLNVETDMLGKYARKREGGVTKEFLREAGFLT